MNNKLLKKMEDTLFSIVLSVLALSVILAVMSWIGGYMMCWAPCEVCHQYKHCNEMKMQRTGKDDIICKECFNKRRKND